MRAIIIYICRASKRWNLHNISYAKFSNSLHRNLAKRYLFDKSIICIWFSVFHTKNCVIKLLLLLTITTILFVINVIELIEIIAVRNNDIVITIIIITSSRIRTVVVYVVIIGVHNSCSCSSSKSSCCSHRCFMFYGHFCLQSGLNGPSDLQR